MGIPIIDYNEECSYSHYPSMQKILLISILVLLLFTSGSCELESELESSYGLFKGELNVKEQEMYNMLFSVLNLLNEVIYRSIMILSISVTGLLGVLSFGF